MSEIKIQFPYKRNEGYIGDTHGRGMRNLPAYLARHHIISYPFMYTFAVVLFWYAANVECTEKMSRTLDQFYQKDKDKNKNKNKNWYDILNVIRQNKEKENCLDNVEDKIGYIYKICWAEANLFIGPASCYREDDPSQRMECCPIGLSNNQKILADKVMKNWNNISRSETIGEAYKDISIRINSGKNLKAFVDSFLEYLVCTKEIYVTSYDDWLITNGKKDFEFWINLSDKRDLLMEKPEKFQFRLRKEENKKTNLECICVTKWETESTTNVYVEGIHKKLSNNREFLKGRFC